MRKKSISKTIKEFAGIFGIQILVENLPNFYITDNLDEIKIFLQKIALL